MLELLLVVNPMNYWLLLALVYTIGFTVLVAQNRKTSGDHARWVLASGFSLLVFSLVCELVLGYALQEWAVRSFYWARITLALAWLGHGYLLAFWPDNRYLRWGTWVLVASSLLALALVALAPITRAEDWFVTSQPVYGQLSDLLATNRPLRWGALLLNVYGAGAMVVVAAMGMRGEWKQVLSRVCMFAGAALLLTPIYWPPQEANVTFFLVEAAGPVLAFIGIQSELQMTVSSQKSTRRKAKRGRA